MFGAVCPARGVGAALVLPSVNTEAMDLHLAEIGMRVTPGALAVVVLDGAGWHQPGERLRIPSNVSLLHLPPYSPQLNPVENVWQPCGGTISPTACSTHTTRSSTHAATPGTLSPVHQIASGQSLLGHGHRSLVNCSGIMRPVRGRLNSPDVVCLCPIQSGSGLRWAALVLIGTVSARKFCTADGVGA